jgi:hypothetical protein|tara:strand:- start:545 stop:1096 length:552 start_codon:yes stop_codon:yes gene_type:complete
MAKSIFLIVIIFMSLVACESKNKPTEDGESLSEKKKDDKNKGNEDKLAEPKFVIEPNRVLTMELDGMVCSMGCGGSIRKELNATGAIADCDFDFEDERTMDVATIQFDKNKITADEIVKIVSEINDGQFSIGKTASEEFIAPPIVKENNTSSRRTSDAKIKVVSSTSFRMPNIFDLFSGLLSF